MAQLVVELHVPLEPDRSVAEGEYQFPWIDDLTEAIDELGDTTETELYDDGEEFADHFVFLLTGADEATVLAAAARLATRTAVPAGAFAIVTDSDATELGAGRRVDIT